MRKDADVQVTVLVVNLNSHVAYTWSTPCYLPQRFIRTQGSGTQGGPCSVFVNRWRTKSLQPLSPRDPTKICGKSCKTAIFGIISRQISIEESATDPGMKNQSVDSSVVASVIQQ